MDLFPACCCFLPVELGLLVAWMATSRSYPKLARCLMGCLVSFAAIACIGFVSAMFLSSPNMVEPACEGDNARIRHLIRSGVDPNDDFEGLTAIDCAAENGHWDTVRVLLAAGANPNRGDSGPSPLKLAKRAHQESIVRLLLAAGAREDRPSRHNPR